MFSFKKFLGEEAEKPEPRMTPRAKTALLAADSSAGAAPASKVFLALTTTECFALEVLRGLNVNLPSLRYEIEVGSTSLLMGEVLRLAEEERRGFGHQYLGTEHLMLAMIRCSPCVENYLKSEGVDLETARQQVMRELDPNFQSE